MCISRCLKVGFGLERNIVYTVAIFIGACRAVTSYCFGKNIPNYIIFVVCLACSQSCMKHHWPHISDPDHLHECFLPIWPSGYDKWSSQSQRHKGQLKKHSYDANMTQRKITPR